MAKRSSNTQGNPYHDESTGEFTSADGASQKAGKAKSGVRMKPGVDLSAFKANKSGLRLKFGASLAKMEGILKDINQPSDVPRLRSARDIEDHVTEFFSNQVISKIDALYGKSTDCSSYQFHPKSNPHMTLEIFPNVLGKYRYKDNHAKVLSAAEFDRLERVWSGDRIYRGISSSGQKAKNIVNGYGRVDLDNFDYYCPNGGNCYGSNIYTTISINYARNYAGYGGGTLIRGLLDSQNSWSMSYNSVCGIMRSIDGQKVYSSVAQHLEKSGLDHDRADRIARSFSHAATGDPGTVAILMGLDYYISESHQRNLFNLGKWIIREV